MCLHLVQHQYMRAIFAYKRCSKSRAKIYVEYALTILKTIKKVTSSPVNQKIG